jgi:hypothetical protein
MIIADLHHLQIIEEGSIVGGDGSNSFFELLDVTYQQASLIQLGLSSAQAVSLVGNANGSALAVNIPNVTQTF